MHTTKFILSLVFIALPYHQYGPVSSVWANMGLISSLNLHHNTYRSQSTLFLQNIHIQFVRAKSNICCSRNLESPFCGTYTGTIHIYTGRYTYTGTIHIYTGAIHYIRDDTHIQGRYTFIRGRYTNMGTIHIYTETIHIYRGDIHLYGDDTLYTGTIHIWECQIVWVGPSYFVYTSWRPVISLACNTCIVYTPNVAGCNPWGNETYTHSFPLHYIDIFMSSLKTLRHLLWRYWI